MSPIISTISSSYRNYITTKASTGGVYTPVISTTNLYSHWDFSRLTDPVSTSYTTNLTAIPNSSGLLIGASSTTPTMYHRTIGGTYSTSISTQNGLKCLSLAGFSGTANNGSFFQSDGNAFPDITSSSVSYTWIAVWKHSTSIANWTRLYRWFLNGYSYDFNHGLWFINSSSTELNAINYSAAQRFASITDSNRASTAIVHYDIVTISGSNYIASSNTTAGGAFTTTGSITTPTYGTATNANRYFQIRPVDYTTNTSYPAMVACEYAFYNRAMTQSEQTTTIAALRSKWG